MHHSAFFAVASLVKLTTAAYILEDDFSSETFFNKFSFYTGHDPTNGYVSYVNQSTAQNAGLINTDNDLVYIGVDSSNVAFGSGRASVRLTSNKSYNHGLFILDLAHMPGGICGTWPAFWLLAPNWPNQGEIDIIEGVNDNANNAITLHSSNGCSITNNGAFTGALGTTNCYVNAPGQASNVGCGIQDQNTQSYGAGFNAIGGGVYATEWTSNDINVWFFPRGDIPQEISDGNPDPASWGEPVAQFQGACNIDSHFQNQQIVFDTTFCGDWAGNVWGSTPACSALAPTCQNYVQNNPGAFAGAFWLVNSLQVYQANGAVSAIKHFSNTEETKNRTLPLLTTPLAMGGGLPPVRRRRHSFA